MIRKLSLAVAMALGISPLGAQALGLGDIDLKSALNQKLSAEIALLSADTEVLDDVRVTLATQEAFNRAGVDRPFILTKMNFLPIRLSSGKSVIRVTSSDPVREPFLNFLIEVNWPKGKLVREYTVLLDPPVTLDRRPAPVQTPTGTDLVSSSVSRRLEGSTAQVNRLENGAATGSTAAEYGPTKRHDTLWGIAKSNRHGGASIHQMMMALFEANPEAFIARNINNLKVGQVLRIPDRDQVLSMSQRAAYNAYRQQVQAWKADRQSAQVAREVVAKPTQSTATSMPKITEGATTEDSGDHLKIASAELDKANPPGSSEGPDVAKAVEQVKNDLIMAQEEKARALQESGELKSRVEDLESQLQDLQRLLELKNNQLAQFQAAVAKAEEATAETAIQADTATTNGEEKPGIETTEPAAMPETASEEEGVTPVTDTVGDQPDADQEMQPTTEASSTESSIPEATTTEETPVAQPPVAPASEEMAAAKPPVATTPVPVEKTQGIVDRIMGDTTLLGGLIGGIVVLLALLWVWISRRRSNSADFQESILVSTIDEEEDKVVDAADAMASQQTDETSFLSDFSPSDIDALQDETGEVDPLAEADVYIAYGRYQQAEELVRQAIHKDPERLELKSKLAEILFATKNAEGYQELAEGLQRDGVAEKSPDSWSKILSMGAQLVPGAALFAGAASAASEVAEEAEGSDIDLGEDLTDAFNLDDLDAEDLVAEKSDHQEDDDNLDFDLDIGLDELNKGLNEDTSSLEAMGDIEDGQEDNTDIDLGLNLDEETTALDLEDAEALQSELSNSIEGSDLDELTDPNLMLGEDDQGTAEDLSAFDEPTSEVVQLKVDDPMEDVEVADLANDSGLDLGDLGDLDLDLSSFKDSPGLDEQTTDQIELDQESLEEDSYTLDDIDVSGDESLEIPELAEADAEDEVSTKLDLARAYIDMGDSDGARDILNEVLGEGSDEQKGAAQQMLDSIV